MKYKLINKTTQEEHICYKVVIDGFDYYNSDNIIEEGCWCLYNKNHNSRNTLWELVQCGKIESEEMHPHSNGKLLLWMVRIIATTNPYIDVLKVNINFEINSGL